MMLFIRLHKKTILNYRKLISIKMQNKSFLNTNTIEEEKNLEIMWSGI